MRVGEYGSEKTTTWAPCARISSIRSTKPCSTAAGTGSSGGRRSSVAGQLRAQADSVRAPLRRPAVGPQRPRTDPQRREACPTGRLRPGGQVGPASATAPTPGRRRSRAAPARRRHHSGARAGPAPTPRTSRPPAAGPSSRPLSVPDSQADEHGLRQQVVLGEAAHQESLGLQAHAALGDALHADIPAARLADEVLEHVGLKAVAGRRGAHHEDVRLAEMAPGWRGRRRSAAATRWPRAADRDR